MNEKKETETLRDLVSCSLDGSNHGAFTNGFLMGWNLCMSIMYCLGLRGANIIEAYYTARHHWNHLHDYIRTGFDILNIDRHTFVGRPYDGIRFKKGYVYVLRADNGVYKIGQSTQIDDRIKQLSIQLPYELELVHVIETDHVINAEQLLHNRYAEKRRGGEWFALTDEDLEEIKALSHLHASAGEDIALSFAGWQKIANGEQDESEQNQG